MVEAPKEKKNICLWIGRRRQPARATNGDDLDLDLGVEEMRQVAVLFVS